MHVSSTTECKLFHLNVKYLLCWDVILACKFPARAFHFSSGAAVIQLVNCVSWIGWAVLLVHSQAFPISVWNFCFLFWSPKFLLLLCRFIDGYKDSWCNEQHTKTNLRFLLAGIYLTCTMISNVRNFFWWFGCLITDMSANLVSSVKTPEGSGEVSFSCTHLPKKLRKWNMHRM